MTIQYNVPVKILDNTKDSVPTFLQGYKVFTDRHGNLDRTCFSYECFPLIGSFVVVKTLKKDAAEKAVEVLSGIEGLLVLPVTESVLEDETGGLRLVRAG